MAALFYSTYCFYLLVTTLGKNHAIFLNDLQSLASQSVVFRPAPYTLLESLLEIQNHGL